MASPDKFDALQLEKTELHLVSVSRKSIYYIYIIYTFSRHWEHLDGSLSPEFLEKHAKIFGMTHSFLRERVAENCLCRKKNLESGREIVNAARWRRGIIFWNGASTIYQTLFCEFIDLRLLSAVSANGRRSEDPIAPCSHISWLSRQRRIYEEESVYPLLHFFLSSCSFVRPSGTVWVDLGWIEVHDQHFPF